MIIAGDHRTTDGADERLELQTLKGEQEHYSVARDRDIKVVILSSKSSSSMPSPMLIHDSDAANMCARMGGIHGKKSVAGVRISLTKYVSQQARKHEDSQLSGTLFPTSDFEQHL